MSVQSDSFLTLFGMVCVLGGGGGGGQKVPALTLNVNNFFNFKANATKLSNFSRMDKFENTLV